jgi:hypothetical protein
VASAPASVASNVYLARGRGKKKKEERKKKMLRLLISTTGHAHVFHPELAGTKQSIAGANLVSKLSIQLRKNKGK